MSGLRSKATAKRDSGLLYRCHGEQGAIDQNWPRSVEFQIQETDTGDLWAVGTQVTVRSRRREAEPRPLFVYDSQGEPVAFELKGPMGNRCLKAEDHEKARGEWNTLELISWKDQSVHIVNGVVVMRLEKARQEEGGALVPLTSGRISLQTEGAELFYRDVEIRPLTAPPAELAKLPGTR